MDSFSLSSVIVAVVEDITMNIADQRLLEQKVVELEPKAKVVRWTLTQLAEKAALKEDKSLLVDDQEVSFLYKRGPL
jgi:hypothetical protein